ncbi:MAG: GNAT family N-acetyltransferase [Thaumarchaeota archaeon]|nr:GNAT family N-acetyltransferase [Nitrososphaerota archaeon]
MKKPRGGAPTAYEVRELRAADLGKGLVETLGNLSTTGGLTSAAARKVLRTMRRSPLYHVLVAVGSDGQVVGATTLLIEQKFIHGGGLVGHIEDVAVRKGHEGRGVGGSLVKAAVEMAEELACYKCILDCKDELVGFYEKLGFRRHDVGMRIDFKRGPR